MCVCVMCCFSLFRVCLVGLFSRVLLFSFSEWWYLSVLLFTDVCFLCLVSPSSPLPSSLSHFSLLSSLTPPYLPSSLPPSSLFSFPPSSLPPSSLPPSSLFFSLTPPSFHPSPFLPPFSLPPPLPTHSLLAVTFNSYFMSPFSPYVHTSPLPHTLTPHPPLLCGSRDGSAVGLCPCTIRMLSTGRWEPRRSAFPVLMTPYKEKCVSYMCTHVHTYIKLVCYSRACTPCLQALCASAHALSCIHKCAGLKLKVHIAAHVCMYMCNCYELIAAICNLITAS